MRLTLSNFGIWNKKTFEFHDHGITLISGQSGKGKTTIFRAINYALTGEGTKLVTLGEKKCTVVFEYNNMVITRCNTPSRLTVVFDNCTYEGDEAQSFIYQQIGKNFEIAGYIQQKGENSFLCMTPADKLRFLEKVAFSDVPIDELKEKAREFVSSAELNLFSVQGEMKYLQENPVQQPEKFQYTRDQIKSKIAELRSTAILSANLKQLENEKLQQHLLQQKKLSLSQRISDIHIETVPDVICSNGEEEDVRLHYEYEDYLREKKSVNELEMYIQKNQKEIDRLTVELSLIRLPTIEEKSELQSDFIELAATLQHYKTQQVHKRIISSFSQSRYEELGKSIPQLEEKLRCLLQSREVKVCPCCKKHLRVTEGRLEVFESTATTTVGYSLDKERELKTQIADQKKELTNLEVIKCQIDRMPRMEEEIELDQSEFEEAIEKNKQEQMKLEMSEKKHAELTKDKNKALNDTNIIKMKSRIKEFYGRVEPRLPLRSKLELERAISDRKIREREIQKTIQENALKVTRKSELEKELISLPECKNINTLETDLLKIVNEIQTIQQELLKYTQLEKEYQVYKEHLELYRTYVNNRKRISQTLLEAEKRFTLSKKFREALQTAEMLALNSIIEEINSHLSVYLALFFPENPLTLDLCLFKANEKTKTIKNQVNIQVGYRGVNTDLATLSGGEKDRVNLAFTLALAEIFSIPLLMLDETLSSLDRETTENILEHIQKDSRCILIVAHQVSLGLFDHVFTV